MSKRNRMPGLRLRGGIWHIEKRCRFAPNGWIHESTGLSSRPEAEQHLIRRLAELEALANRHQQAVFTFEEAAFRYLEEIAHKPSADTIAMHIDRLLPFIGNLELQLVHDGTLKPFVEQELARGLSPKSINNVIGVISAVLNRAARMWRNDQGLPWLQQAPPRLTKLTAKGRQAKPYPLSWPEQDRLFALLPEHTADAALFAVNTGCREQEVCRLRWDWEVKLPQLDTSVFVLPAEFTKTQTERVVVLNSIAKQVVESRRSLGDEHVFTYRGNRIAKLRSSAWVRAWRKAGLPTGPEVLKGVHNLRHTFGRRLRSMGVPLETRKTLLGHANGDITTHYSVAEVGELIEAAELVTNREKSDSPTLTILSASRAVGKVSAEASKKSRKVL